MTGIVILILLASNILLARMLWRKPVSSDSVAGQSVCESVEKTSVQATASPDGDITGVLGASSYDPDAFRALVKDVASAVVPLVIEEYGTFADAGFPDNDVPEDNPRIPDEQLGDVFTNVTLSDITGESPDIAEPRAEGLDFESLDTTMKVLREESESPEDLSVARHTLRQIEGTAMKEAIALDPAISKRILMIELDLSESGIPSEHSDSLSPSDGGDNDSGKRKLKYHADIDTTGIDAINFNVYH